MIDAGKYDDAFDHAVNDKRFPLPPQFIGRKGEIFVKVFHFEEPLKNEGVIKAMSREGYRPAILMELLTLGVAQPELQRSMNIIALGSIYTFLGLPNEPYIGNDKPDYRVIPKRILTDTSLRSNSAGWYFLGVRLNSNFNLAL